MKLVKKTIKEGKEEFYIRHLQIINTLIPDKDKVMVNKEIEVLATFMSLDKSIIEEDMFNTLARKQVKQKLNNMSNGALGNHLKQLINKKYLFKNEITNRITVNPAIIPDEPSQGYMIKLIKE